MKLKYTKIMKKMSDMRTLFLSMLMLWGAGIASAQIQKGSFFVETSFGNIGINNSKGQFAVRDTVTSSSETRLFAFDLYPRAGYLLTDNLAVGAELDLNFYSSTTDYFNADEVKTSNTQSASMSIGLGPFVRYYFGRSSNGKSAFYGQLTVGLIGDLKKQYTSQSFDTTGAVTSTFGYDYPKPYKYIYGTAQVGWNRMLSNNVALNMSIGYRYLATSQSYSYSYTYPDGSNTTSDTYKSTNTSGNFSWSGGFTMFIPTK